MLIINDLPRMSCCKLIDYFFYVCTCIIVINYKLYCGFLRKIKIGTTIFQSLMENYGKLNYLFTKPSVFFSQKTTNIPKNYILVNK